MFVWVLGALHAGVVAAAAQSAASPIVARSDATGVRSDGDVRVPPDVSDLRAEEQAKYARVTDYLRASGLRAYVRDAIMPHGKGGDFHVTFRFADDEASRRAILGILSNQQIFSLGPFGGVHVPAVGASKRSQALDFRSRHGVFGRGSLEVMINKDTLEGYADIDHFDLYGGAAPALAHTFFELLPHLVLRLF